MWYDTNVWKFRIDGKSQYLDRIKESEVQNKIIVYSLYFCNYHVDNLNVFFDNL
ncbi:hypothetical protein ACP6PK_24575 [Dapis sp. BLCC M172]